MLEFLHEQFYKTKIIAMDKEVYVMKHDFSWFFKKKSLSDASKMV